MRMRIYDSNKRVGFWAQKVVVNTLMEELDGSVLEVHKREMSVMTYHALKNAEAKWKPCKLQL